MTTTPSLIERLQDAASEAMSATAAAQSYLPEPGQGRREVEAHGTLAEAINAVADEIERLRGIVPEVLEKLNDELCAENEALKAELAALKASQEPVPVPWDDVMRAILAMDAEARRRGGMFPQTFDEQRKDTEAVRSVVASLEFYKTQLHRLADWPKVAAPVPAAPLAEAVKLAYGHLWHVNNEPMAPIPLRSPEAAAYEARKVLRDLLTSEQRGEGINKVAAILAAKETK